MTIKHPQQIKLGSLLTAIAQEAGGLNEAEVEAFNQLRQETLPTPIICALHEG